MSAARFGSVVPVRIRPGYMNTPKILESTTGARGSVRYPGSLSALLQTSLHALPHGSITRSSALRRSF